MNRVNPKELPDDLRIEYYLGKDRLKNLFWKQEIPPMWSIPVRFDTGDHHSEKAKNTEWRDLRTDVVYRLNNYGYRHDEDFDIDDLKKHKLILALGCSNTFGMCLPREEAWPSVLQDLIGDEYRVLNLGIGGASNDNIARIGYSSIKCLMPSTVAVCCMWAPMSLREFVSKDFKGGVHTLENDNLPYEDWWDHIDWVSNNYNFWKNRSLLESVCQSGQISFYDLQINLDDEKYGLDTIQFGNYNATGPLTNKAMARWFHRRILNQPSLYQDLSRP